MTDRKTLDQMTSDDLDALYERLESARDAATLHRQSLISTAELYAAIEAEPAPAATQATEPRKAAQPRDCLFARDGGRACNASDRCATCDPKPTVPCPGFPTDCPNPRNATTSPPETHAGIRCGCGDQTKEKTDA
ncbi:hypothetical protein [Streptomyces sp. NBC_01614]|uniref:hypothetical protein n=1 Tax=Streptomyces sp. NBC_01614 TaxID=2975897 RepID=UPI00386BED24